MSTELVATRLGAEAQHAQMLERVCVEFRIDTAEQKAHFLGQLHVETAGFRRYLESFDYAADRLTAVFRGRITEEQAKRFGRIDASVRKRTGWTMPNQPAEQEALANLVYGGEWGRKNLGNTSPGDGWRFRGRGDIQLTGRRNVAEYSAQTYKSDRLVQLPQLLTEYPDRTRCAGWFWKTRKCDTLLTGDIEADCKAITKVINGGAHGLEARLAQTKRALALFQELAP